MSSSRVIFPASSVRAVPRLRGEGRRSDPPIYVPGPPPTMKDIDRMIPIPEEHREFLEGLVDEFKRQRERS